MSPLVALAAFLLLPPAACAQWRIGADFGMLAFHGGSARRVPADSATIAPFGPDELGLKGSYGFGPWELGLAVHSATPGLSVVAGGIDYVDHTALDLLTFEPMLGYRVFGSSTSNQLWLDLGPAFNLWKPSGGDVRSTVGGTAAISLRQHTVGRLGTDIRVHASLGPSPFKASELPPELKPTSLWRFGLSFGLDYRL